MTVYVDDQARPALQHWTTDLDSRLEAHRAGHGTRLMAVVKAAGISWQLARTWPGSRCPRNNAQQERHQPRNGRQDT